MLNIHKYNADNHAENTYVPNIVHYLQKNYKNKITSHQHIGPRGSAIQQEVHKMLIKLHKYKCSNGFPTIGVGHKIIPEDPVRYIKTGLKSKTEAVEILRSDITKAEKAANKYSWFKDLNPPRQAVIMSMIFQMGEDGFKRFNNMIRAIELGKFIMASNEGMDSKWYREDSPSRALRHMRQLRIGGWLTEYIKFKVEV